MQYDYCMYLYVCRSQLLIELSILPECIYWITSYPLNKFTYLHSANDQTSINLYPSYVHKFAIH